MKMKICKWNVDLTTYCDNKDEIISVKSNELVPEDYIKEDDTLEDLFVRAFSLNILRIIELDVPIQNDRFCLIRRFDNHYTYIIKQGCDDAEWNCCKILSDNRDWS